ncbi:hypothetical protein [Paenibacillus sanguinis]|uniref:hypothetical protein n=1 Tax=Paenibacillus sanguinis TaxID=225906 RepID=UPI00036A3E48|nr:hypothetical protein [Paenibacillus sanguinis]
MNDISPDWKGSTAKERAAIDSILKHEGTPGAIVAFDNLKHVFSSYWYWFMLSTLWISYSGWSDLRMWRRLFRSMRPRRQTSLMKPSEWAAFRELPSTFTVYRAHRPDETDWISYTLSRSLAESWVAQRGGYLGVYKLHKRDCLALFLRRGEDEILMLEPTKARRINI